MQAINFYQHPLRPLKASVLSSYGIIFDRCGLQFFMADTRFERTKDHIMSDHQMDKLKKWLLTYRWEPKFLLTPVSMFLQRYDDCWYGYQKDLYSIVDFLYTNDIHNLFVLTGDAHSSAVGEFLINNSYPVIKTPTSPESLKVVEVMSSSFYQLFHDSASNYYGQMDLNDPSGAGDTYFLRHAYGQDALREQVIQENNFCLSHYDHLRKTIQFRFYKSGGDLIKKYDFPLAIKPAYQSIFIESDQ